MLPSKRETEGGTARTWTGAQSILLESFTSPWGGMTRGLAPPLSLKPCIMSAPQYLVGKTYFSECFCFALLCFTLCLLTAGQFGIPEGIVFSMPVKFENGTWVVLTDLKDIEISEQTMARMTSDLMQVRSE